MKKLALLSLILAVTACSDNDRSSVDIDVDTTRTYDITIMNLTNNQPLAPPGALLHDRGFKAWEVAVSASVELEMMAEGGDSSQILALLPDNPQFLAQAPIAPGGSISFTLSTDESELNHLTLQGMWVNTNDAFSGISAMELNDLEVGQTRTILANVLDAGTENNTEAAGTMPGPADGGEGFNAERDDTNPVVTYHSGVVTQDDGHASSVLNQSHRFDNPAMRITITAR